MRRPSEIAVEEQLPHHRGEQIEPIAREICVLGYAPNLSGGVVNVTKVFLEHYPNAHLFPVLVQYKPRHRAAVVFLKRLVAFARAAFLRENPKLVAVVVVGSRGDAVRAVPLIAICKLRGLPVCCQYHKDANALFADMNGIALRLVRSSFRTADAHWFLSSALKSDMVEQIPDLRNAFVLPNAISSPWVNVPPLPLERRDLEIVFFGRWAAEKGVHDLIKVMESFGGGRTCHVYADARPSKAVEGCVFHSWCSESDVLDVMKRARLLVLPSYAEAYPTVILEALACGTPFVATAVGGVIDIANGSRGGMTVRPGDCEQMAHSIEMLLSNQLAWNDASTSGRNWVESHYVEHLEPKWRKFASYMIDFDDKSIDLELLLSE